MRLRRAGLASCLALALLLAACASTSAVTPSPTPTFTPVATVTPTAMPTVASLPSFSDWHLAYLDARYTLHAVSLDGKLDVVGPHLTDLTMNGFGVVTAGFSPNGRLFAYSGDEHDGIVDVTGSKRYDTSKWPAATYNLFWSPDGKTLEADDNEGGIALIHLSDGSVTYLASAAVAAGVHSALGWIDATHLAVTLLQPGTAGSVPTQSIGSFDIITGTTRTLATFSSKSLGNPDFALSSDGSEAIFYNHQFRDDPFTPQVDLINTATGGVTPLPTITSVMGVDGFATVAWRPGTRTFAATSDSGDKNWLFDVGSDTARQVNVAGYPVGWSPDGKTLILSGGYQSEINAGPFQLSAVSFPANGAPKLTVLTGVAYTFDYLGFVKTA